MSGLRCLVCGGPTENDYMKATAHCSACDVEWDWGDLQGYDKTKDRRLQVALKRMVGG